jgi:hypothetical protein
MSIYDPNGNYQLDKEHPSAHVLTAVSQTTKTAAKDLIINTIFPVKKVKINLSYCLSVSDLDTWYLSSICPAFADTGGYIASLSNFKAQKAAEHIYANDNSYVEYTLRQPMMLAGNWDLKLNQIGATTLNSLTYILDIELIG